MRNVFVHLSVIIVLQYMAFFSKATVFNRSSINISVLGFPYLTQHEGYDNPAILECSCQRVTTYINMHFKWSAILLYKLLSFNLPVKTECVKGAHKEHISVLTFALFAIYKG